MVISNVFYFHPYLGKIPILTNIFQGDWNLPTSYEFVLDVFIPNFLGEAFVSVKVFSLLSIKSLFFLNSRAWV